MIFKDFKTICTEAVLQRCSVKKVFLDISQGSQENTCARVSFLIKLQAWPATLLKKRLWHRCFPVNIVKSLRTSVCRSFHISQYYIDSLSLFLSAVVKCIFCSLTELRIVQIIKIVSSKITFQIRQMAYVEPEPLF